MSSAPGSCQRVLMTADTVGGVWTYAVELAEALASRGVQVMLATMGRRLSAEQRRRVSSLENVVVHESEYALEWMTEPWSDVSRAGDWLLGLEAQFQPDVVHLNGFAHAALPWEAPVLVGAHSCVLSWWRAVHGADAPAEWSEYARVVRDGLNAADVVVTPSAHLRDQLTELYGLNTPPRVIANGRSHRRFRPGRKEPFVLSVGRAWDPAKNIAQLTSIAGELPWPVRVAGDAAGPDGTTADLSAVEWLGRLSEAETASLLERAEIYALPAKYEPFGLSVLEAALCGCALVLGDIPSLRENWDDAALFVDPNDPGALCKAIKGLVESPSLRASLGARARVRATGFTPEHMAAAYHGSYRELVRAAQITDAARAFLFT